METKSGPFTFPELQAVTSLGRGEVRECINRAIISAPVGVGQGNHRSYTKWNLVEGVIAAALLQHVRAGFVSTLMWRLRAILQLRRIDPEKPNDRANPPRGEDAGQDAFLIASAGTIRPPRNGPHVTTTDRGLEAFCHLPIDLEQAVRFVDHMIPSKL
jgi:hypothetical protein